VGKLSDLQAAVMSGTFHGTKAEFTIVDTPQDNINPHTNEPYNERSVYVNELLEAGLAAGDAPVAVGVGADEDIPF